eukprot:3569335-Amphidinium_carterae.1
MSTLWEGIVCRFSFLSALHSRGLLQVGNLGSTVLFGVCHRGPPEMAGPLAIAATELTAPTAADEHRQWTVVGEDNLDLQPIKEPPFDMQKRSQILSKGMCNLLKIHDTDNAYASYVVLDL